MILGPLQVSHRHRLCIEPGIHIALKSQQRLLGILWRELFIPAQVAIKIEVTQLIADFHQLRNLVGRHLPQLFDKLSRVVEKVWRGVLTGRRLCFKIQCFGWGNHH